MTSQASVYADIIESADDIEKRAETCLIDANRMIAWLEEADETGTTNETRALDRICKELRGIFCETRALRNTAEEIDTSDSPEEP